jgi:hypothetical protein
MAVTVANLVQGPATLYIGDFGATEPADNAVGTAPSSAVWTDLGGTVDGAEITIKQEYKELEVDQVVDIPGRRLTKRDMIVKTKLAEPTFENLVYALNDGTTATGTGYKNFTPAFTDSATQPTYRALILHGWAAAAGGGGQSKRRMVILRRVLSSDDVEISYMKDKQTLLTVSWSVHYVDNATAPFKIVDEA